MESCPPTIPGRCTQLGGGNFTNYTISKRIAGTSTWEQVTTLNSQAAATYTVTGLDNGTSCDFQIVAVTPTTTTAGATVTVAGVPVTSGEAPASIALPVSETTVVLEVTASDPRFTEEYTVVVTRLPAPPVPDNGGGGPSPGIPVVPPASIALGNSVSAVTENGVVPSGISVTPTTANDGYIVRGNDFSLTVEAVTGSGAPSSNGTGGAVRTPQGGSLEISGDGYMGSSQVAAFAIPRETNRTKSTMRSVPGAVFLGYAMTTPSGSISTVVGIPDSMKVGDYVLQVNGLTPVDTVRSVNLRLDVYAAATPKAGMVREAAFYIGGSDQLSQAGMAKLCAMVDAIPAGARNVKVSVVGVSVSLAKAAGIIPYLSVRENLTLARDRAQRIAGYLEKAGVAGDYTVSISTSFQVREVNKAADAFNAPVTSSAGKPLTTASIAFLEPPAT